MTTKKIILDVQVVSDFICPWCAIGKRRLEIALQNFKQQHSTIIINPIIWKPYRLLPGYLQPMKKSTFYEKKFGNKETTEKAFARVAVEGVNVGIHFNFTPESMIGPTTDAHRLVKWCPVENRNTLVENLFQAHHVKGLLISDYKTLLQCSVDAGLNEKDVLNFLNSNELKDEIIEEIEKTKNDLSMMGGVPQFLFTFHVDDDDSNKGNTEIKTMVSGAQDDNYFKLILEKAWMKVVGDVMNL